MVARGEEMNQTVEYIKELNCYRIIMVFTREITDYLVETWKLGYQPVRTAKGGVSVTVKVEKQRYVTAHVDTLGSYRSRAGKPEWSS